MINKKKVAIVLLCLLMTSSNGFALSLIDDIEDTENSFIDSLRVDPSIKMETRLGSRSFIDKEDWNGFKLKENYKYLGNKNILHEFNEKSQYIKTIKKTEIHNTIENSHQPMQNSIGFLGNPSNYKLEIKYLESLEGEMERYIKSGFEDMPTLHISTIKDDQSYFNQLENKIKPIVSCVPTSVTMFLHILDLKELKPDDVSKKTRFYSGGTSIGNVMTAIKSDYDLDRITNTWNFTLDSIKNNIKNDMPMMAEVMSGYLDYDYTSDKEKSENMRTSRFYRVNKEKKNDYYHLILITGYAEINGKTFIEIYEPWSPHGVWANGKMIPGGKGKFIEYEELKRIESGPLIFFRG